MTETQTEIRARDVEPGMILLVEWGHRQVRRFVAQVDLVDESRVDIHFLLTHITASPTDMLTRVG